MKILLLTLFALPFSMLFAQGNLQFNQVLSYSQLYNTSNSSGTYSYTSSTYQVPIGKVWKVEKFLMNKINISSSGFLRINNAYELAPSDVNSGPIWLKSGDQLVALTSQSGGSNYSGAYFISIIEFNIIP